MYGEVTGYGPPVGQRSWVEQVMGLPVSLLARGEQLELDVAPFYDELRWVDAVFSPYREERCSHETGVSSPEAATSCWHRTHTGA